jgi:two-component system, NarL family, response regulator NreC
MEMQKIKVLIVDDHAIMRDGIKALLALSADIEVVGEAADGREALEMVKQLSPEVALMDIAMPILGGMEATRRIAKEFPQVKVVALTQYDNKESVLSIIEAGASGFISKIAPSELAPAIRHVHNGDFFLSPSVAKFVVEDYRFKSTQQKKDDPYSELTDREKDVLKLVAEGYSTQEMADMLVISPKTADGHKRNVIDKLGLSNRTDLIKYAIRRGIIEL